MSVTMRRKRQHKRLAVFLVVIIAVVVSGIAYMKFTGSSNRVALDAESLCPSSGPTGYTVVLIDGTDSFSPIQMADLNRYFDKLKADIPKHSQIAVYAPKEMTAESFLKPELKVCNPGDGEGVSGLTANPQQIRRRYEVGFSDQIDRALKGGLTSTGANSSPIMEMIQAVTIDAFPIADPKPKRLIIVSDMLQNSAWYSQYRNSSLVFEDVIKLPGFQSIYADFSGVQVEVLYIGRKGSESLQTNRHGVFWESYFRHMNGQLRSITRIGG